MDDESQPISILERDHIVDDLLSEYRASQIDEKNEDSMSNNHSNYFSNLQNVSYGAYCINDNDIEEEKKNDDDHQYHLLDWIDTLQLPLQQNITNYSKTKQYHKTLQIQQQQHHNNNNNQHKIRDWQKW